MIAANTLPSDAFFHDVLDTEGQAVPAIQLYIAGFSCKPFSRLHNKTRLLQEPQADIYKAVRRRIATEKPPCFVLENVEGIRRCLSEVRTDLEGCGYMVLVELLDPSILGEPLLRPRYYFIGIRSDLTLCNALAAEKFVKLMWSRISFRCHKATLVERLLPAEHPFIVQHQADRKLRWQDARAQGFPDGSGVKWKDKHIQWDAAHTLPAVAKLTCSPDDLFLHLARERDAWTKLSQVVGEAHHMVCDLLQSIDRARQRAKAPCNGRASVRQASCFDARLMAVGGWRASVLLAMCPQPAGRAVKLLAE